MQAKCQFVVAKGQKGKDRQCVFCVSKSLYRVPVIVLWERYYSQGEGGMMRAVQEKARKSQDQTVVETGATEWLNESYVCKKGSD